MIKFENGLVNISGKGIDILSEYAVIPQLKRCSQKMVEKRKK